MLAVVPHCFLQVASEFKHSRQLDRNWMLITGYLPKKEVDSYSLVAVSSVVVASTEWDRPTGTGPAANSTRAVGGKRWKHLERAPRDASIDQWRETIANGA